MTQSPIINILCARVEVPDIPTLGLTPCDLGEPGIGILIWKAVEPADFSCNSSSLLYKARIRIHLLIGSDAERRWFGHSITGAEIPIIHIFPAVRNRPPFVLTCCNVSGIEHTVGRSSTSITYDLSASMPIIAHENRPQS